MTERLLDVEEIWQDWPRCPGCGRRRVAVCPCCLLARDEMPLADYIPVPAPLEHTRPPRETCGGGCGHPSPEPVERSRSSPESGEAPAAEEQDAILLLCPQCDEAFRPVFRQLCPQCGHDFGDGVTTPVAEPVESNARALFVIFGLLALAAGILGYCWYLFQR